MSNSSGTPSGWFPDSSNPNQERFWDGSAWTEQTRPRGPQPGPTGYQQTGNPKADAKAAKAYAKASRPWFKKKRFIIPMALVVLVVAGSALGGGGDDGSETATDTTSGSSTVASTPSSEAPSAGDESADAVEPTTEPTKASQPAEEKPADKPVAVKASAMLQEFADNELAADAKYKGKTVKVSGVVDKIDTALFDEDKYVLRLGGGGEYEIFTVNCNDMSTDELATLNKGDAVTVLGDFDDGGDLGVEIKDCSLA
ncbi:OB-fold protein [Nocardioides flavescens]|uniref:DUF2510 domain-containing protein n=1 Tax=Nocardioides flavescens TaxID=2691959 RepID=A0A6L7EPH3_9ACTN|nr:DUF2510 domain-containing protein [Nocardioides flavescens]MXG88500.1 DUF2510 domain-containing protein [Nocardioides flavescens]